MATKKKSVTATEKLHAELLKNLKDRDMDNPIFNERVEDYMAFYFQLNVLKLDLLENGTMEFDDRTGSLVPRKSVAEAVRVSREIGKIWQELGFNEIVKAKGTPDGDDVL